jgi:HD-GYP domain-containing protein (c-di-GMP phosphodiesterase class II)
MTVDRSYRMALSHAAAREQLIANAGTQFDPEVVTAFLASLDEAPEAPEAAEAGGEPLAP